MHSKGSSPVCFVEYVVLNCFVIGDQYIERQLANQRGKYFINVSKLASRVN